jgi:tetrahydromethanopterin S-methyltransferase subunit G
MDGGDRLERIEEKIDHLTDEVHKMEVSQARRDIRLDHIEQHVSNHSDSLSRCFKRLDDLETKPAKAALRLWSSIGGIALSVFVTAAITLLLVTVGFNR